MLKLPALLDANKHVLLHIADVDPRIAPTVSLIHTAEVGTILT